MKEITTTELAKKMETEKGLSIIDVREDEEVAQGMIPGAKHIRLSEIPERVNEMDKNEHHFIVCRSGGRSGKACEFLSSQGYEVTNVAGGMLDWNGEVKK
ncbi:rhodanese-like domain-containing protein [Virgibacillus halodenitrificans]|jgi:rhodanese-related sulfurtransferase|uniref:rhodanese-like domain-containing protein n=1 Tax=Virgibacillus halodenitrificans TaxID=1482 RepID=UPI00045C8075|nr:rhodanese-like domain-containing protein [Virgibacillus halodenitrificans]MCG1027715.1 rhodanese-like domain-containing protein [Virgibacillus halodenitrificans]MEC2157770.1 rhodanese-like domain-containing protein [Virgibacillus halodenitrificans]MYL59455.1 rhodanese-like domain-containing protein [Virgibacillus halodenitrificans]CDQ31802.1 Thiosulfate sulfurtransferase PspE precursor [Virgibacillus halodenitrificans]